MSRKMLFFLSLISVLTELIDAVPMLGGGDERPCKTIKAAGLDSLDGTCETYSDCQKFISLPEQTSSSPHCDSYSETCCVRRLCDVTISTGGLVKNEKYYCTNALKHRQEAVDMRYRVSLGESPGFGQKPRATPPKAPYAIIVSGDDTPCPGPWTFSGLKYGNAFNENALICWVDSPPTISFQNQGQDPVIGVWPTDNTETASVPDDGYYNFDDENGENS